MPITESLCYGKIPVAPRAGPFSEAGGVFATYFKPGSEEDSVSCIEALLDSDELRINLEKAIRTQFQPRNWADIWSDIKRGLEKVQCTRNAAPNIPLGRMLSFGRLANPGIKPDLCTAEIYRAGDGWSSPGASGCQIIREGAQLCFSSDLAKDSPLRVYIAVRGSSDEAIIVTLEGAPGGTVKQIIKPKSVGWLSVRLDQLRDRFFAYTIKISAEPKAAATVLVVAASPEADLTQRQKIIEAALRGVFGFDQDTDFSQRDGSLLSPSKMAS